MAYDSTYQNISSTPVKLPPIGKCDANTAKEFFKDQLSYYNPLRRRDMAICRRSELYDQGYQWLVPYGTAFDAVGNFGGWTPSIYDSNNPLAVPLPVFNKGLSARQNESARLARPNYRVHVRPRQTDAAIDAREAAKITERIVEADLKRIGWDRLKDRRSYHSPVYGGYWIKSFWEQTYDRTTRVPLPSAVGCANPQCSFTLASPSATSREMSGKGSTYQNLAPGSITTNPSNATFTFSSCPECARDGIDSPLQPAPLSMEEVASGPKDSLGRNLYRDEPLGQTQISIPSPYDIFPRDMGIRLNWGQQSEWAECHIETLDWIALRYPKNAHKVKAENPGTLAAYHPLTAVPLSFGYPGSSGGLALFRNSCRVKEWHKAPWMEWIPASPDLGPDSQEGHYEFNKGRSLVMAGDVILFDGPLMLDSLTHPDQSVARIKLEYVPWEFRDGCERLQGLSLWEILFDPQDILNQTTSQTAAVRERCAVPTIITSKQHRIDLLKNPGIPGRLVAIDVDSDAPSFRPSVMEGTNTTIAPGVINERDTASAMIDSLAGLVEVEKGQVPPNVSASVAISQLKNFTGERREPRINRIKESDTRVFTHLAELDQALIIEPREVAYLDVTKQEAWAMYEGADMGGQTDIEIKAIPDFEEEAETRQIVTDAVNSKMLDPAGPKARIIADLLKLPEELYAGETVQVDTAQNEWLRFTRSDRIPQVDPMLDDNAIHLEQHGKDLMSGEGQELEESADWDNALKALGLQWEQISQMAMFQPPQPGVSLQDVIFNLWNMALMQLQQAGAWQPSGDPAALQKLLAWRSHMEAHRLISQQRQMQAMAQPMPAAPGGQADASGNQVSPASPNPQSPTQTIVNAGISGGGAQ